MKKCSFTENEAYFSGVMFMSSSFRRSTMVMQKCLFANNSVRVDENSRGDNSLSLFGTHSELIDCEFLGNSSCLSYSCNTAYFYDGTSSINNCTFSEQVYTSIKVSGIKLNITNSRFYGHKGTCLNYNSDITIVGSQFAAYADIFLKSYDLLANLTVINTSFTTGQLVLYYEFESGQVQFINCSFNIPVGFGTIGHMLLKNCIISNVKGYFINVAYDKKFDVYIPVAQLEIVDCVIIANNVSDDEPFIFVRNVSFTMTNCLYTGNVAKKHIMLNGTTNVTIKNVTFFNNSLGGMDYTLQDGKSLLIVNNTAVEIDNCKFESNNLESGSLMLVFRNVVRVMNSVFSGHHHAIFYEMILVYYSTKVEFSNNKFINNSYPHIFGVWSTILLVIDRCSFCNDGTVFNIWNTNDMLLQRTTSCKINSDMGRFNGNNLRIFSCTFRCNGYSPFSIGEWSTIYLLDSEVRFDNLENSTLIKGSPYATGWY